MIDIYEERAQCFVHQFNNYTLYDDGHLVIPVNVVVHISMAYNQWALKPVEKK